MMLTILCSSSVFAYDNDSEWKFNVRPYIWAAGIDGNVSATGVPNVKISKSFSDIFSKLDIGGMLTFEGDKDKYGLFADLMYIELSDRGRIPSLGNVGAYAKSKTTTALMTAKYSIVDTDESDVDVVAGARYWSVNNSVRVDPPVNLSPLQRKSWFDPQIGFKGKTILSPKSQIEGWAIMSPKSKITADLMLSYGYYISENSLLSIGYRHLSVEHGRDGFNMDASLNGPILGFEFSF